MKFYTLEPEVPGEFGQDTKLNHSSNPRSVTALTYVFTNWQGDDIVTSTPCFMVTGRLAEALRAHMLSGFTHTPIPVSVEPDYENFMSEDPLTQNWQWLHFTGTAFSEDIALDSHLNLIVSERALRVMRQYKLEQAEITEIEPHL